VAEKAGGGAPKFVEKREAAEGRKSAGGILASSPSRGVLALFGGRASPRSRGGFLSRVRKKKVRGGNLPGPVKVAVVVGCRTKA